jgi:hypothetical protein
METKSIFSIALENMFTEKAVLIVRLKGTAREEIIKCESLQEAKDVRKEMFATRQDISFALVATESQYKTFQESI